MEILILIAAMLLGVAAGTFTGLTPGIHTNLIASVFIGATTITSIFSPFPAVIFIASMAITHTFVDFIPSIYLGAPEEDNFLSVLPGHQLLKEGRGHEAVILTLFGSLSALLIILLVTPIILFFSQTLQKAIIKLIPFILIFIAIYMIIREEKMLKTATIFILASFLGYLSLNTPIKQPLLPLLTGLFGASGLISSLANKTKIPKQKIQKISDIKLKKEDIKNGIIGATITAPICSFLPGVGAGYAALISSEIKNYTKEGFLFLLGALNTIVMGVSFILVYSIGRTRTGAAAAISEIIKQPSFTQIIIIILFIVIAGVLATAISIKVSKIFSNNVLKINYKIISFTILVFLIIIVSIFSGYLGLIVFTTATAIGLATIKMGIKRTHMMGSILVPTALYYLVPI